MSPCPGIASTPAPPYYAVIFTSKRAAGDRGYAEMAARMETLGAGQRGFLGLESVRGVDGVGITVSYWRDEASILVWRQEGEHEKAQRGGRETWYEHYEVRVAKVERAYGRQHVHPCDDAMSSGRGNRASGPCS